MCNVFCVVGPTSSGKSRVALTLAQHTGGVILNADSLQVYGNLPHLTARPWEKEMGGVPHFLYGFLSPHDPYSVARWLEDASPLVARFQEEQRPVIFVGGTGLYIKALLEGLVFVPCVNEDVRTHVRTLYGTEGMGGLARLWQDQGKARLGPQPLDPQRTMRALEVYLSTGRPLNQWQETPPKPLVPQARVIYLAPPKDVLMARSQERLGWAMEESLPEMMSLMADDPHLAKAPIMQALGAKELLAQCQGRLTPDEAFQASCTRTRQYIKRQTTWFRHQLKDATVLTQDTPREVADALLALL